MNTYKIYFTDGTTSIKETEKHINQVIQFYVQSNQKLIENGKAQVKKIRILKSKDLGVNYSSYIYVFIKNETGIYE